MPNSFTTSNGFTLIETMLALTILTGAVLAIMQFFPFNMDVTQRARRHTIAAYLAQEGMEEAIAAAYDGIGTGFWEAKERLATSTVSYLYPFQRAIRIDYANESLATTTTETGLKRVDVTVFWQSPLINTERSYTLTTLLAQP